MELGIPPYLRAIWSTGVITVDKDSSVSVIKSPGMGKSNKTNKKRVWINLFLPCLNSSLPLVFPFLVWGNLWLQLFDVVVTILSLIHLRV